MSKSKIIVALDFPNAKSALTLVDRLHPDLCKLKVGKELFTRTGPNIVRQLVNLNFDVFLDLKFHDIPNTTANAALAAADLGVWMVNLHAQGGRKMLQTAKTELVKHGHKTLLIAVTVLTSLNQTDMLEIGFTSSPAKQVLKLAKLAEDCELDGVVCSALELNLLRENLGQEFLLVTPGIRPEGASVNDQTRVMTPANAVKMGSNYLVMGRPITKASNPLEALSQVNSSLD